MDITRKDGNTAFVVSWMNHTDTSPVFYSSELQPIHEYKLQVMQNGFADNTLWVLKCININIFSSSKTFTWTHEFLKECFETGQERKTIHKDYYCGSLPWDAFFFFLTVNNKWLCCENNEKGVN